jgi:hypothetical protein
MLPHDLLRRLKDLFALNPPANEEDLARLQSAVGTLPNEILDIYRFHNGSENVAVEGDISLPVRLLPIDEAIENNLEVASFLGDTPKAGKVALLWGDDNSNYVGVYTDGLLSGWLVVLDHEETMLAPAYRSAAAFLSRVLASLPGVAPEDEAAYDAVMVPREIPTTHDDPGYLDRDRKLVTTFRALYEQERDEGLRRLYALCAICLTPVADTGAVISFFADDDLCTPEAAVRLLEVRGYRGGTEELEKLAREGGHNGHMAALRQLIRLQTDEADQALSRLRKDLKGDKLQTLEQTLEMWARPRLKLQPPRWP